MSHCQSCEQQRGERVSLADMLPGTRYYVSQRGVSGWSGVFMGVAHRAEPDDVRELLLFDVDKATVSVLAQGVTVYSVRGA